MHIGLELLGLTYVFIQRALVLWSTGVSIIVIVIVPAVLIIASRMKKKR